jgi:hypothetical protein
MDFDRCKRLMQINYGYPPVEGFPRGVFKWRVCRRLKEEEKKGINCIKNYIYDMDERSIWLLQSIADHGGVVKLLGKIAYDLVGEAENR